MLVTCVDFTNRQKCVSLSLIEAKYILAIEAVKGIKWITLMITEKTENRR